MMENIHSETYSLLIDTYIKDSQEKSKLFKALDNFPCIKKADWAVNGLTIKEVILQQRLLAFACVEGIFLADHFVLFIG